MAKLVWQPPGQEPMAFSIAQERVTVGRDAGNDIRLPESAVSARHAVIMTRMGVSTVHDLNSSNGTWINEKSIASQQLHHGDVVQFGRLAMTFLEAADTPPTHRPVPESPPQAKVPMTAGISPPPAVGHAYPQRPLDAPEVDEIDRLLGSIRSHRSDEETEQQRKREEMLAEWKKVMDYCATLKTRLGNQPRVRYFEISDRRNEVIIRFERAAGQPTQQLLLSWGHMERRGIGADGIWMRRHSQPDKRYETCADAMRDLVTLIAHMLA